MAEEPKYQSLDELIAAFDKQSETAFKPGARARVRRREGERARDEWAERAPSWPTMREARASARWRRQTSVYRAEKVAADSLKTIQGEVEQPIDRTVLEWMLRSAEQNGDLRTLRDMGSPKLAMKATKSDDPDKTDELASRLIAEIDRRARLYIDQPRIRKSK